MANRRYTSRAILLRCLLALLALRIFFHVFNNSKPSRSGHSEINGSCLRELHFSLRDVDSGIDQNFYRQNILLKDYDALSESKHRLDSEGKVLLKGVLPVETVKSLRQDVLHVEHYLGNVLSTKDVRWCSRYCKT